MRGLLVSPISKDFVENKGILQKFDQQAEAFSTLLADVDSVCTGLAGPYLNGELFGRYTFKGRGLNSLNHFWHFYSHLTALCKRERYDFVYVRYPFALPSFIKWLASLKKANPNCCVVLEVPTYPYRDEMRTPKQKILLALDDVGKHRLKKHVDVVVTFFGQHEIFGIPCIQSGNGIDVDRFPLKTANTNDGHLSLITVANVAKWHGIDRAIMGLANASPEVRERIVLNIVGNGPEKARLEEMVQELDVQDNVCFHGIQTGDALSALFNQSDIALGSLGMHRLGLERSSSLKVREYCARGMPFIAASNDPDFPPDWPYAMQFDATDDPIDIQRIVEFYETLISNQPNYASDMRRYATENLTWVAKLSAVAKRIQSHASSAASTTGS